MTSKKLSIISSEPTPPPKPEVRFKSSSSKHVRRLEVQARMERLWHEDPEQFNPLRDCMERERLERTWRLINDFTQLPNLRCVDLGCGCGIFAKRLKEAKAVVNVVDISSIALKLAAEQTPAPDAFVQDCLPHTTLPDDAFDLVLALDVIAYLPAEDYRLFFAEANRIMSDSGFVVCSTPLDIDTDNPLDSFAALAETEFQIERWVLSYHLLYIRICRFFKSPGLFVKAFRDQEYRKKILNEKGWWWKINSSRPLVYIWWGLQWIASPIAGWLKQSRWMMNGLEKISRFIWSSSGISHAIFIGKRRPLYKTDEIPVELKHKREVWE